ncbi:hypothetical protein D9756_005651 [Leucocoprinus leucothites]|uniref:Uncharacterized protein n=1 Tax=Leucocoprinus leucothites TaxID=201217 RepID=A0A8H5FZ59_9AGAR|nr:hypothetical protein D9756_005651 [Leucoagaricus leucothites]
MIILDDDETSQTQSSERSPLKSPVSPVTATRYDSSTSHAPPPYVTTGPSSTHSQHYHHPQSPISPHPHSPHPHQSQAHYRHDSFSAPYAGSVHSTTNLPPHIVKMIEDREIRQKALYRFFSSFAVAWFIIIVWSTLIRGVTLNFAHHNTANDIRVPDVPPSPSHPLGRWSQLSSIHKVESHGVGSDDAEPKPRNLALALPVLIPQPSITITIIPTPVAERILSIAYPPSSPSRAVD